MNQNENNLCNRQEKNYFLTEENAMVIKSGLNTFELLNSLNDRRRRNLQSKTQFKQSKKYKFRVCAKKYGAVSKIANEV